MKKFRVLLLCVFTCYLSLALCRHTNAQDADKATALTKAILESKTKPEIFATFEKLSDLYFAEHKYPEYIKLLSSFSAKRKDLEPYAHYFSALSRYYQLKHLEEIQAWDDYFSSGNAFREELANSAQKAIEATAAGDPVYLYARLLLWRFHNDQQDAFLDGSLSDLMSAALAYSKETSDIKSLKDVADQLFAGGEKGKSKELYKLYVGKLVNSSIKDEELSDTANSFYGEGNLDLAEEVFDAYIARITQSQAKEKVLPLLAEIVKKFSFQQKGPYDPAYAEKIFRKIEEVGGSDAFNEELLYARGYSLEKNKEYREAARRYRELLARFPAARYTDELQYKIGIIETYVARDRKSGEASFKELAQKESITPQVIASIYQLGLLSQWADEIDTARKYYAALLEKAKDGFKETVALAKERVKEMDELRPIEYNLKTFMDVSLKEEFQAHDTTKVELKSSLCKGGSSGEYHISSTVFTGESGCMPTEVQYLWSGHLGYATPSTEDAAFVTSYMHPGTKEINLVVVSPAGVIDRNIDMIDVE